MRTPLAILASATIVTIATAWSMENDKLIAWRKLEASVRKLRPLVASPHFAPNMDAKAKACAARLAEIDDALDARASSSKGIGAPWMWTPRYREELVALVNDVTPMLDELAHIAESRRGLPPIPCEPRLGGTRHRTNLFCAAALVVSDEAQARQRFEQAWEVATMEDNGSWIPLAIQIANAGVIADGIRHRTARFEQRDEVLVSNMEKALSRTFTQRQELERNARALVQMVDVSNRSEIEMWAIEAGAVASAEMYPAFIGAVSCEDLAARMGDKPFVAMWICDQERWPSIAHNLRL